MPWLWSPIGKISFFKSIQVKKLYIFSPAGSFFLVLQVNVCQSALIPRNLPCPKKFLVTRLDWILLSKAYENLDEKIQKSYVSWHWKVMESLKKNWLLAPKMTWEIWWIFTQPLKSPKISLRWTILSKLYEAWAKKTHRSSLMKKLTKV